MAKFRDVTILHASDGSEWCGFLAKKFNRRCDIDLHSVDVDELPYINPPEIEASIRESYALVLLVTEGFIQYMEANREWFPAMLEKNNDRLTTVIAATLCIDYTECLDEFDIGNYPHPLWKFCRILDDASNVQEVILAVLDMVDANKETHMESLLPTDEISTISPIFESRMCQMFPTKVEMNQDSIAIVFTEEVEGEVTLVFDGTSETLATSNINPFCVSFIPPVLPPGSHNVHILVNGEEIEVLSLLYCSTEFTSLELMKQFFGATSVEELDKVLALQYRKSICSDETLKRLVDLASVQQDLDPNSSYPTALHWASANGLSDLTSEMLNSPCAAYICQTQNCYGQTVSDLAQQGGHEKLKVYIDDFIETNHSADAWDMYVQHSPAFDDTYEESHYKTMITKEPEDRLENPNTSMTAEQPMYSKDDNDDIYEQMSAAPPVHVRPPPAIPSRDPIYDVPPTPCKALHKTESLKKKERKLSDGAVGCRCQDELIVINQGVKNGEFTIDAAEAFVNAWKQRNMHDGPASASFRDKQKSLLAFRETYKSSLSVLLKATMNTMTTVSEVQGPTGKIQAISEPIRYRKDPLAPVDRLRSQRTSDTNSSRSSSNSVRSRVSQDSGYRVSADFVSDSDLNDPVPEERRPLAQQYRKSINFEKNEQKPPLPLRSAKKPPVVYARKPSNKKK